MAWTEQQSEAITTRDCGLIVSAAAGSGKTSVLVERLLRILEDETPEHRVPADRMIVVTFTNDAAAEMRSRLYQALDDQLQKQPENQWLYQQQVRLQNAHICTISSFCFDLIRDNLTEQGITAGFRILNETEAKLIASKAADTVLNRWHAERQEEMQLLWNCFCEKNDKPLEELLLELHSFLGSVPFREQWTKQVLEELNQPLSDSAYHRAFLAQLEQRARDCRAPGKRGGRPGGCCVRFRAGQQCPALGRDRCSLPGKGAANAASAGTGCGKDSCAHPGKKPEPG